MRPRVISLSLVIIRKSELIDYITFREQTARQTLKNTDAKDAQGKKA